MSDTQQTEPTSVELAAQLAEVQRKQAIYDAEIAPLMLQVRQLVQKHDMRMYSVIQIGHVGKQTHTVSSGYVDETAHRNLLLGAMLEEMPPAQLFMAYLGGEMKTLYAASRVMAGLTDLLEKIEGTVEAQDATKH